MNLGVETRAQQPGSYLFVTPGATGAGIYRDDGSLVWWKPCPYRYCYDLKVVRYHGASYLALWSGNLGGEVTLYDSHYAPVARIGAGGLYAPDQTDPHEFTITREGDALLGIIDPVYTSVDGHLEWVYQYVVQKLSLVQTASGIHTGRLLFQWKSLTDVPVTRSHLRDPGKGGTWDYFHGNSISEDTDGNLLVSSRNTWAVYKIDDTPHTARYGHVIWEVGGKGDHTLATPWCYQHDVTGLGANEYILYDTGGTGPGCQAGSSQHPARAIIFRVAPNEHPAGVRLVRSYAHSPSIYSAHMGSAQRLGNGDVFVDWADVPEITEYRASGQVDLDLALSAHSYRGFRFPWTGQPATAPVAAATEQSGGGSTVWASWNGATGVAAWRVLAGAQSGTLSVVRSAVPATGFETSISLDAQYGVVAVQALDTQNRVMATSPPSVTAP